MVMQVSFCGLCSSFIAFSCWLEWEGTCCCFSGTEQTTFFKMVPTEDQNFSWIGRLWKRNIIIEIIWLCLRCPNQNHLKITYQGGMLKRQEMNSKWIVMFQNVELPVCPLNGRYMHWYERNTELAYNGRWNLGTFSGAPATLLWITSWSVMQQLLWPYHPLMSNSVSGLSLVNSFMGLCCCSVWHLEL